MISRELTRVEAIESTALTAKSGQMPREERTMQTSAEGIRSSVSGIAIRFDRRKYLGKLPNSR